MVKEKLAPLESCGVGGGTAGKACWHVGWVYRYAYVWLLAKAREELGGQISHRSRARDVKGVGWKQGGPCMAATQVQQL